MQKLKVGDLVLVKSPHENRGWYYLILNVSQQSDGWTSHLLTGKYYSLLHNDRRAFAWSKGFIEDCVTVVSPKNLEQINEKTC